MVFPAFLAFSSSAVIHAKCSSFLFWGAAQIISVFVPIKEIPFFANNPDITVLFTGVLMIVIVMFFPGGFAEIVLRIKLLIMKLVKKWRIRRYGIEE